MKAAEQGYKTGILDLTAGEMGTRGTPETRLKEAAKAARILRVAHRENLRLPDANLEVTKQTKLAVAQRIRALQASHRDSSLLGGPASRPLHRRAAGLRRLLSRGTEAIADRRRGVSPVQDPVFDGLLPRCPPDVCRGHFAPLRPAVPAILAYHSQFSPKAKDKKSKVDIPLDRLHHEVNLIARYYGQMAGVEYAEPFLVKEVMQVEDVVKLPVRSV